MRVPDFERVVHINESQAELDRFEHQAASILTLGLALSGVSYAILMLVML
jgi:hypothetical protein